METVPYNAKADQWVADCEAAGWDQFRADRDALDHPVNTSPLMALFLPVFGAAVALCVVLA